jgi:hypothetical protein
MPAPLDIRQSSISTTGYLDGLGRRSIRFDRELGATLECLHVRPELRAYEDALLAQACALSELGEPRVVRIRSLEREHGRLVVISELPRGDRLSDVFDSRPTGAASTIDATFGFLLQILPALANLHRKSIVHGAIAPGRVMVESSGRIVLADAIFGTALPRLNLSRQRLWHELEIAFAPEEGKAGTGADVAQAALCSIAVALGRQLDTEDPRQALPSMIEHLAQLSDARGGQTLSNDVRTLFRALLPVFGAGSDMTAAQAAERVREIATGALDEAGCTSAFAGFLRCDTAPTVIATFDESGSSSAPAPVALSQAIERAPVLPALEDASAALETETDQTLTRSLLGVTDGTEDSQTAVVLSFVERARKLVTAVPIPWRIAAAAVLVIVGVVLAGFPRGLMQGDDGTVKASAPSAQTAPEAPAAAAPAPSDTAATGILTVSSEPAGAKVLLDGVEAGRTPLRLASVATGRHTVTTISGDVTTKRTVRVEAGKTATVNIPAMGWVTVQSPVKLEVALGARQLGTSDQRRIELAPGRHAITLRNRSVAYSSVHTVEVSAGQEAQLNVAPTGRVNLNAQPWAEVWIDGTRVGETPLANLQVPLGAREFVFKHPQYGERRLTATVSTNPTALSVDFTKQAQRP